MVAHLPTKERFIAHEKVNNFKLINNNIKASHIALDHDFLCILSLDKNAYCMGKNSYGQLGTGNLTPSATLQKVSVVKEPLKFITAKNNAVCVITENNKAYCWGHSQYYNLGPLRGDQLNAVEFQNPLD